VHNAAAPGRRAHRHKVHEAAALCIGCMEQQLCVPLAELCCSSRDLVRAAGCPARTARDCMLGLHQGSLLLLLLQSLFMSMDKDNDGRLSAADLHRAIEQVCAAPASLSAAHSVCSSSIPTAARVRCQRHRLYSMKCAAGIPTAVRQA
jgi:hypothetical protein